MGVSHPSNSFSDKEYKMPEPKQTEPKKPVEPEEDDDTVVEDKDDEVEDEDEDDSTETSDDLGKSQR